MISSFNHRRCWAEIDRAALHHNLRVVRDLVPTGTAVAAVLKADAYGHGLALAGETLKGVVDWFAVANVTEALELSRVAPGVSILILGPVLPEERELVVRHCFNAVVSELEEVKAFQHCAQEIGETVRLHLAVDTGMGRIGVWQEEAGALAEAIRQLPGVALVGIGTHLPVADEDAEWTHRELEEWQRVVARVRALGEIEWVHALNSAGVMGFGNDPASHGNLVRAGLMLYGSAPLPEFQPMLRPVLTWKTRITLIRDVPAGRSVSYGRTFITPRPMRIATLAAGYGDGYTRHLSNVGAEVLIGGQRVPVLGRVTMDQILVDLSKVPGAVVGDEVVLMGKQGGQEILAAELAAKAGTIPWEIFTGITRRVSRIAV